MANIHVNSTTAGTPASPYANWTDAAATMGAAQAVAVAGDTVYVHPSHSETAAAAGFTWAGTAANPIKIICGTPVSPIIDVGITDLQNTAIWGIAATGSSLGWGGLGLYVHGIVFKVTGSSGSAILSLASTSLAQWTLNECQIYWTGVGGAGAHIGNSNEGDGTIVFNKCQFRFGKDTHFLRCMGNFLFKDCSVLSGSALPTTMFSIGYSTLDSPGFVEVDGFDFSVLANTVKLASFGKAGTGRFKNLKTPTSWGTISNLPFTAELLGGSKVEILNYDAASNTNYKYWVETKLGRSLNENTIKVNSANASGNSQTTYSRRVWSLASVGYPASIYRGPPITKYVVANGQYKGIFLDIAYDGSVSLTDKEFWIEVSAMTTANSPLSTQYSSCPPHLTAASNLLTSAETWDGLTGTGPNGSSNWIKSYVYQGGIPLIADGWVTVTPCFALPSKVIFMNENFVVADEGAIGP